MPIYECPFCNLTSNRRYNLNTHIIRKHPGSDISPNLLPGSYQNINSKNGRYPCPFCNLISNRRYNLNTHIIRKHPGSDISPNLLPGSYQTNSEYNRHLAEYTEKNLNPFTPLSPTDFNSNTSNSNHVTTVSKSVINIRRKNKKFYSTIKEFLQYLQIMPNNFLIYNNFIPYKSISNTNIENPILFRIYRCKNCSKNILIEFNGFDQINLFKDIHCNLCGLQKQSQKQNSDLYNLEIKKLFEYNILSRIDDFKIYLKSIKIPQDIYVKLKIERVPFFYYENNNKNDTPSWLINFMLSEEFVDLGVIEENQLVYRLTNSDEKNIEITIDELIEYFNYGNSTFGLFKFQTKDISEYFFIYIQFKRNLDTLKENNLSLID